MKVSPRYILISLSLVIIGALIGIIAAITTPLRYVQLVEPPIYNISNTEFNKKFEADPGKYIFIDVRDRATYAAGHPKGAINIPLAQLYTEREKLPKSDREIVLICGNYSASGVGFSYLQHYGFRNISRIPGGYTEWLVAGLPIEKGTTTPEY